MHVQNWFFSCQSGFVSMFLKPNHKNLRKGEGGFLPLPNSRHKLYLSCDCWKLISAQGSPFCHIKEHIHKLKGLGCRCLGQGAIVFCCMSLFCFFQLYLYLCKNHVCFKLISFLSKVACVFLFSFSFLTMFTHTLPFF